METDEFRKTVFKITNLVIITMYVPGKILGIEFIGRTFRQTVKSPAGDTIHVRTNFHFN